ncbi:HNH endonuclease [Ferrovibrio xuzhouensis]|uniref:HNH endonuclease n=1 Tax=Ferrovibrio xuzhouensis TaxID=1576914 RepID=A0ABV7VGN6_9PROT
MRCIFCKQTAKKFSSVEHIIPESLGNKNFVLPKGFVCDSCNNYFSSKIEKPFLETGFLQNLRARNFIQSKKGRIPPHQVLLPHIDGIHGLHFGLSGTHKLDLSVSAARSLFKMKEGTLILPPGSIPEKRITSRFVAKAAIESLTHRLMGTHGWQEAVIDDPQLDPLREYARYGNGEKYWPVHIRRIYSENAYILDGEERYLITHESDFLFTSPESRLPDGSISSEVYFIIALFGVEFSINLGGPEIDGYLKWLQKNNSKSPLYQKPPFPIDDIQGVKYPFS